MSGVGILLSGADFSGNNLGQITLGNDADVQKYINATGLSDSAKITAMNLFVRKLKTNNLWLKITSVYPFLGDTSAKHLINLRDTHTVASIKGTGGTFTNAGFDTAGTAYLESFEMNSNNRTLLVCRYVKNLVYQNNYLSGFSNSNITGTMIYVSTGLRSTVGYSWSSGINALQGSNLAVGKSIVCASVHSGRQTLIDSGGTYSATTTFTESTGVIKMPIGATKSSTATNVSNLVLKTSIIGSYMTPDELAMLYMLVDEFETSINR